MKILVTYRGGPLDGRKERDVEAPTVGYVREVFYRTKDADSSTHLYRGRYRGGRKLQLRYIGIAPVDHPTTEAFAENFQ